MERKDLMQKITAKIQTEGRSSSYNPLVQKPISLNPIGPGNYADGFGGYAYIGPPPDFGGTYGAYTDSQGRKQIGIKANKMFSMVDGSPMQLTSELSPQERTALLSQMEDANESYKCPHCRSELCISVASAIEAEQLHCPHCATAMEGAMDKAKSCFSKLQEKKNMATTVKASEGAAKAGEILNVGAQGKDLAKEAMKVETPQEANPHEKAEKATPLEVSPKGVSEIKPMDELAKDLVKAGESSAEEKAKKEAEEKAAKEKEKELEASIRAKVEAEFTAKADAQKKAQLTAAKEKFKARQRAKTAAATARGSFDAKTLTNLKRELRVMATLDAKKFAEVKKNAKLSVLCAEVEKTLHPKAFRAQVRAELKALAAEDMEAAEEAKKELEFVAPEILMEEPVELKPKDPMAQSGAEGAPAASAPAKAEGEDMGGMGGAEGGDAEAAAKAAKEKEEKEKADAAAAAAGVAPASEGAPAEAMQTEWLASLETLKGERIEMSLYDETAENPYWNVVVDSEPVARIFLGDQEDAQAIRASFVTEAYANNLGDLIGRMGVQKILPMVKARLFAHKVDEKEVTARIREKAKLEAKAEFDGKIDTLRQDFLRAVSTVLVAADKNFYQEEGRHALKSGLFNSLLQAGLNEQNAVWAVEAGFEDAPAFFEFITAKAIEMMDMPKEARESVERTVKASGKITIETAEQPQEDNIVDRLVKSSVNAIAMGGNVSGENLGSIRSKIGLKATRR